MQIINLYKYIRKDGGTTVSPVEPDCEYAEMFRLIADKGKVLVKGDILTSCTDVDSTEGWEEIDAPEELHEEEPIEEPTPDPVEETPAE
jgi:hypothetical protein